MLFYQTLLIAFLFPTALFAIPPPLPSAGVVEREIEQEYEGKELELEKEIPPVEVEIPEKRLVTKGARRVSIQEIEIEGNEAVSSEEIQCWVEQYLDQTLNISEIHEICKIIDQKYAEKGYFLARSYPPPQDIRGGVLKIQILEGRIGSIRIEGNQFYSTAFICRYFQPFCKRSLNYDAFLKALLLLNENPDLSAGVLFEKGKEVGTADLVVRVSDKKPMHLYFNENNYGRDLTTNTQLGGRFDWGSCVLYGDAFSIAEVIGFPMNALYFTDVTYSIPLNVKGTSLEFGYLFSKFHIEELLSLQLRGRSMIGTIKATQAMRRSKSLSIDLFGYFDIKQIKNFTLGITSSNDRLRVVTAGALIDHHNSARGRDYLNCRFSFGIPNFLGGMNAVSNDSSRIGGGGRFIQFNIDYDRIQQLYREYLLYFHISGQWSPSKLTLPQQLYIGGSNTVRGYPLSVALGDSGYYANLETRFPLPMWKERPFFRTKKTWKEAVQIVGFVDTGATFFNGGSSLFLTGAGFGVRVLAPFTLSFSYDLGFPLQHKDLSNGPFNYIRVTAQPF